MQRSKLKLTAREADPEELRQYGVVPLFQSARRFQMWDYSVSMQYAHIRSPMHSTLDTNIDLIFAGVRYLALNTSMCGLSVSVCESLVGFGDKIELADTDSAYLLESEGRRLIVVAISLWIFENQLDLFGQKRCQVGAEKGAEKVSG